ncbi:hypothetical protein CRYUN_Cryun09bG0016100 [Craigia yunnanensis]
MGILFAGLALMAIGAGGIRPCNIAFGADQFDTTIKTRRSQPESFFNWWHFTFTFALVNTLTGVVYIQTNISWIIGFAIPTGWQSFYGHDLHESGSKLSRTKRFSCLDKAAIIADQMAAAIEKQRWAVVLKQGSFESSITYEHISTPATVCLVRFNRSICCSGPNGISHRAIAGVHENCCWSNLLC